MPNSENNYLMTTPNDNTVKYNLDIKSQNCSLKQFGIFKPIYT